MAAIINVENLGKKYQLTHQSEKYLALRDNLTEIIKWPLKFINQKRKDNRQEDFWALKNIDFQIQAGEAVGIIGRNGAGKSTLLKILSRITPPTTGKITLDGRVASLLEVGTGFHPELTGRENIYLNGAILGMRKAEIKNKFNEIVAFAEIEKFLDTPVKRYSSGMYVRLAFAVAAHLEPEILLIDEVLAVGDVAFQKKCLNKMDDVAKEEGRTVLFVSHNMSAIQKLCTKCILIENGSLKKIGETAEVIREYMNLNKALTNITLNERQDRKGNGQIILSNFYLENSKKMPIDFIHSGDDINLCFVLEKKVQKVLKNVEFSFSIATLEGMPLILHRTNYLKSNIKEFGSNNIILRCCVNNFPLTSGSYIIGTYLESDHQLNDSINTAVRIDVARGDFFRNGVSYVENHSPMLINASWSNE